MLVKLNSSLKSYKSMETDIPIHHRSKTTKGGWERSALKLSAAVIILVVGFYVGVFYQKSNTKTPVVATNSSASGVNIGGGYVGYSSANRPIFGQITAVNGTSFTVDNQRTGGSTTVDTSNSTTYTGGTSASLAVGVTIIVRGTTDSSGTIQATSVGINPTIGGGGVSSSGTSSPGGTGTVPPPGTNAD